MQSLVQEAATIEKAVAQAWRKAGNPAQFQVKVLEEPERNFLGMVTRSAKIAIMFEAGAQAAKQPSTEKKQQHPSKESSTKQQRSQKDRTQQERGDKSRDTQQERNGQGRKAEQKRPERRKEQQSQDKSKQQKTEKQPQEQQKKKTEQQEEPAQEKDKTQQQSKQKKPQSLWTQERVTHASNWLRDVLDRMGYENVSFTIEPQNLYLRIELSDHLLSRKDREKQLLASLSSLMMATMQRQYKKAFRGHKVVLTHP